MSEVKVCHISVAHRWFDERIFQKECRSLAAAGYKVVLIIPCETGRSIDGVQIIPIHQLNAILPRIILGLINTSIKAYRENADLYHFHDPDLLLVGLLLKLLGKSVIYDVHEDYKQSLLSRNHIAPLLRKPLAWAFTCFERWASRFFDFIIVVDSNIQTKFPAAKTERITNVPPRSFVETTRTREPDKHLRLVFIGNISENHGIVQMLEALRLLKCREETELHLVGALQKTELTNLWKDEPGIFHHGRLPWEEAHQMLANADLGLLLYQPTPAHWHFTGEGNTKLFEYMGSGLPVIYSDFPKLRALIEPLQCGIPIDPTSPEKIAQAVDTLYENPPLRLRMGSNGREAVATRFNWDMEAQKLLRVYARLLKTPRDKSRQRKQ